MKKGIIGRKVGMTQIFDEKGNVIPVTVIEAGPCTVAQVKTVETDGYDAVQLGFGDVKDKHLTKPEKGHFAKANVEAKKHLREFRVDSIENFKVGDEVICTGIQYDKECPIFKKEKDPRVSPSFRIWGYEGNFGSYAQFSKVQETQCIRKPKKLSWAESACCTATGATVYSMLTHWKGNEIKKGDVVLLSPACSSYDQFKNFEERGRIFKELVNKL